MGRLTGAMLVLALSVVGAYAEGENLYGFDPATRIYVVRPGDTLWDISDEAYQDPWKWPRIWENNPEVDNPHEIFPDGRLVIPFTTGQAPPPPPPEPEPMPEPVTEPEPEPEPEPQPQAEAAPEPEPEVELIEPSASASILREYDQGAKETRLQIDEAPRKSFADGIYVRLGDEGVFADEEDKAPISILGGTDARKNFATGDVVYLSKGENYDMKPGQKFYVYKSDGVMEHPETDEVLGNYLRIQGVLEVESVYEESSAARVSYSSDALTLDMSLMPWEKRSSQIVPIYDDEVVTGRIVRTADNLQTIAAYQICYVDIGERSGIEEGQLLAFFRNQEPRYDPITEEDIRVPDLELGLGVVVETSQKTATVLIVRSRLEIELGDQVRTLVDAS